MSLLLTPDARPAPERQDRLFAPALFVFLLFFYLLTYSGAPHNPDEWVYLGGAQAALSGNLAGVQSHGWLFSLLLAPFYALSMGVPGIGSFQAALLLNIVVTAATGTLVYLALVELDYGHRLRLAAALAYGLCTLAWPYSHYLFREPAAGLALLAATWGLLRFRRTARPLPLLAALVAYAAAVAIKQTALALAPVYGAYFVAWLYLARRQPGRRRMAGQSPWFARLPLSGRILLWALAGGLLVISLFLLVDRVPAYAWTLPRLSIFAALWVSPGWGLFFFAPVLLIAAAGAIVLARAQPAVAWLTWGGGLFYMLLSTTNPFWWGYWAFGPRQLVPLLPLFSLALPAGYVWLARRFGSWGKAFAGILAVVSFGVQLLGVATPFNVYTREVLFLGNVGGADVTWNWSLWPIPGMLRFLRPAVLDFAWITGRAGAVDVRGTLFALLLLATGFALAWLIALLLRRPSARLAGAGSALLVAGWLALSVFLLRQVFFDERYTPELGYPAAAEALRQAARPGDLLITDLWTENLTGPVVALINYCRGGCPPRLDLTRENLTDREQDWQARHRADLAGYRRAWLALERVVEGDPNSVVERWLGEIGYWTGCVWTGPQVRLCRYDLTEGAAITPATISATLGEEIELIGAEVRLNGVQGDMGELHPGDTVQVTLNWQASGTPVTDALLSVQLLGPDGQLVVGLDRRPGNGYRPAPGWQPGEQITDRLALEIPAGAPEGSYTLNALMYDAQTGERLPVRSTGGSVSDVIPLATVVVGRGVQEAGL